MPKIGDPGKQPDDKDKVPIVRLAVQPRPNNRYEALKDKTPVVRLAHVPGAQGDNSLLGQRGVEQIPKHMRPALLVSYFYIKNFLARQSEYAYRDWMMDSGAFSAYNSGKTIDLETYIDFCLSLRETDQTLKEIIALDVIGDGPGSLKNSLRMKERGVDAMPVFHIGDDWAILKEYCAGWDKVGISCRFGETITESLHFYSQCFARSWPKKFHSFGWTDEKMLMKFPLHSSDSASWEIQPCSFGSYWMAGKKYTLPIRGSQQNLRLQVEHFLELEEKLQTKWRKEMAVLEALTPIPQGVVPNSVRLVVGTGRSVRDIGINALSARSDDAEESDSPR